MDAWKSRVGAEERGIRHCHMERCFDGQHRPRLFFRVLPPASLPCTHVPAMAISTKASRGSVVCRSTGVDFRPGFWVVIAPKGSDQNKICRRVTRRSME